jgi:hypothetical protein
MENAPSTAFTLIWVLPPDTQEHQGNDFRSLKLNEMNDPLTLKL